jgi:hypothetical protein
MSERLQIENIAPSPLDSPEQAEHLCVPRELAARMNDGLFVQLLWAADTDQVSIKMEDEKAGNGMQFVVQGADALQAFYHPYAFAPSHSPTPSQVSELHSQ